MGALTRKQHQVGAGCPSGLPKGSLFAVRSNPNPRAHFLLEPQEPTHRKLSLPGLIAGQSTETSTPHPLSSFHSSFSCPFYSIPLPCSFSRPQFPLGGNGETEEGLAFSIL
jgi:hypothetical protein